MFGIKKLKSKVLNLELKINKMEKLANKPDLKIGKEVFYKHYDSHSRASAIDSAGKVLEVRLAFQKEEKYTTPHYYWEAICILDGVVDRWYAPDLTHLQHKHKSLRPNTSTTL
tara:strand:+ start:218 stop:556 length:339 start_codon:yes stop_codon:yes gene_type:complete